MDLFTILWTKHHFPNRTKYSYNHHPPPCVTITSNKESPFLSLLLLLLYLPLSPSPSPLPPGQSLWWSSRRANGSRAGGGSYSGSLVTRQQQAWLCRGTSTTSSECTPSTPWAADPPASTPGDTPPRPQVRPAAVG